MAEIIDKKELEEITEEMTNALKATSKLQEEVSDLNTTVKKIDTSKLNDMTDALKQSRDAAKEASNNSSGLATAMERLGQKMPNIKNAVEKITQSVPNIKTVIDGISKKLPDVKKAMEDIYKATESTEEYFKSFNYYTDTFAEIASKWDKDFESYGSENAKRYANTFIQEMNESLGKLSGMKVSLSVDMESGTLTENGMKDLGLNAQEVTQFAAELASISNSMGQTGDVSLATADTFTKLAGDMSSYFNVDYSTVMEDLQNALLGQTDALEKYRINLSDVQLQTLAYEYGIEKSVEDMTQAEKTQLNMIAILKQSDAYWGNLADTINTPANTFRELTNNCKEVVTVFGQLFMPVLEQVLPVINGVVTAIKDLLFNIAGFFGIEINMDDMGTGTDDVSAGLEAELGGETTYAIGTNSSIGLTDGFLEEVSLYEDAWNKAYENMDKKSQEFADKVTTFLEPVKSIFSNLAIGDYFSVGQDVSTLVIEIVDFLSSAIDSVDWNEIGQKVGEFIAGIDWIGILGSIVDLIAEGINASIEQWQGVFETAPLATALITALGTLGMVLTGNAWMIPISLGIAALSSLIADEEFVENIKSNLEEAGKFIESFFSIETWEAVGSQLTSWFNEEVLDTMKTFCSEWGDDISNNFSTAMETLRYMFSKEAWEDVSKQLKDWWSRNKPSLEGLKLGIKIPTLKISYDAKDLYADVYKLFGLKGAPKFSITFKEYATGGFPEDGWFRASHGEIMGRFDNGQSVVANNMQITNGIANAVYPAVYGAMMAALSQNGNGGNVVVQIDGREVFRTVRKQANNYTRQTGQPAFNY